MRTSDKPFTIDKMQVYEAYISSSTGAILLNLEAAQLEACGISHPERVMGQQWPTFESN
jgi:hypothetical protein